MGGWKGLGFILNKRCIIPTMFGTSYPCELQNWTAQLKQFFTYEINEQTEKSPFFGKINSASQTQKEKQRENERSTDYI